MEDKLIRIRMKIEDLALDTDITKTELDNGIDYMTIGEIKQIMWEMYEYIKDIHNIIME